MTETADSVKAIKAVLAWAMKSQAAPRIAAAIEMAKSEPGIPVLPAELDRDPMLLNTEAGTIELRGGKLRAHDPADLITKLSPVAYDRAATCPTWLKCLETWQDGNQDIIDYLQRAVGYSLTADVGEQCLFFLHGEGANGKSTFLETIMHIMGDYAGTAAPDLLLVRHGEQHPTALADLHGKRLISTVEVDDGRRLAEGLVKQLTGGDTIKARRMKEDFWEIKPTWKIWFAANHKPEIKGQDYAIWRRIRLIPFTTTIPPEQRDKNLTAKLRAEAAGILAWAVRGCLEWQRIGLAEPDEVRAATDTYRGESDTVGEFIADCCSVSRDENYRTKKPDLYSAFRVWAESQGEKRVMSGKRFGMELRKRGIEEDAGKRWYLNVVLIPPE